jgi:putative membrane protein
MTLAAVPASAQFGNPGGLDPGTRESAPGVLIPGQTTVPDRLFTTLAAQGGMAEVELGKLAQQKSRNDAVTAFAKGMIDDHGKSNGNCSCRCAQFRTFRQRQSIQG